VLPRVVENSQGVDYKGPSCLRRTSASPFEWTTDPATVPRKDATVKHVELLTVAAVCLALGTLALGGERITTQATDYFATQIALDPELSPDGKYVAYVRAGNDIMTDRHISDIWFAAVDGSFDRKLASNAGGAGAHQLGGARNGAKWSPDSQRMAYIDAGQIYVIDMTSSEIVKISNLPGAASRLAWSPDGRTIAFVMARRQPKLAIPMPSPPPGGRWRGAPFVSDDSVDRYDGNGRDRSLRNQLFVIPSAGGTARQLSSGPISIGDTPEGYFSWTPDGRSIVVSAYSEPGAFGVPAQTDVFLFDAASGQSTRLTKASGFKDKAAVSPDGQHVAYIGRANEGRMYATPQVWLMNINGGEARSLTAALDRPVDNFAWTPDGQSLLIAYVDTGRYKLARLDLSGHMVPLAENIGSSTSSYLGFLGGGTHISTAGQLIAYCVQDENTLGDVVVRHGNQVRRITDLNRTLFTKRTLAQVDERWSSSSYDSKRIQGFVLKPPAFDAAKRYPMVLEIHGGPNSAWGSQYDYEKQMMAAAGYVVLLVNPRGSIGYGQAFVDEDTFPGEVDAADLMSAVDDLAKEPWIDPTRLYVSGGSGGGVLTAWLIGKTTRFRAAAPYYANLDMQSWTLTTDLPAQVTNRWFKGLPWAMRDEYWRRSPLRLAPNVRTPTLIMTGEEDRRVPASQSEQYFTALKLLGVEARLIRFPDEGHMLANIPSDTIAMTSAIIDWFDKHGGGSGGLALNRVTPSK